MERVTGLSESAIQMWGDGPPDIVFLHDGLGSISQWRGVPEKVASKTGRTVLAYNRAGHGASIPTPTGPWPADWMQREAVSLGELLASVGAEDPLLVGHSDGGSIALIHAAEGGAGRGIVSLAAHAYVEALTVREIQKLREKSAPIITALGKHHDHPEAIFEAWSGAWVSADFASWDIRPMLSAIEVPVLVAQGELDEYVASTHVTDIADAIGANATSRLVPGVRHLMHYDDPELVVRLVVEASG